MATAGSLGPSVWAVSDGRAGNASQVRAIVEALTETSRWMRIAHINGDGHRPDPLTLTPRAPWTWLPSDKWPMAQAALPAEQRSVFKPPWPTLWIGAGRRTAAYSAGMRDWSGGKTLCVHVLDPKTDPGQFDLLVTPSHDDVTGTNVIQTVGSPSHFSADAIETAGLAFADLADERGKSALVVLGGDSKTHAFTAEAVARLAAQLRAIAGEGWRLRMTASRRTPVPVIASMRALADEIGARFWASDDDGPNPYLAWLIFSDAAIVTEDSANMLSDAAYHGLPIHMARLSGKAPKFDRLHDSLIKHGAARWLGERLETWSYTPLREADRVADVIVEKLLDRYPQPDLSNQDVVAPDWL